MPSRERPSTPPVEQQFHTTEQPHQANAPASPPSVSVSRYDRVNTVREEIGLITASGMVKIDARPEFLKRLERLRAELESLPVATDDVA
jgi:hypothetical protein